ncbi:unnamed protein product [Rhizophagus irregularis]|uniref:Uncharacterized protein n=1 Tax=Rhizophagus irregularis TaxID=588596 RepID=A0A916E4S3_9GLOM|nr:unnamed protein product [Rhizophagus irregularis]CAB5359657.1 unnamed protein product [Rhizophagus irregularis]CAB5383760.1 unnamed protein product [Rhizophagus irregularis]
MLNGRNLMILQFNLYLQEFSNEELYNNPTNTSVYIKGPNLYRIFLAKSYRHLQPAEDLTKEMMMTLDEESELFVITGQMKKHR